MATDGEYGTAGIPYTDELIPVEKWPNSSLRFLYREKNNSPQLELIFRFDASAYAFYAPVDPSLPVNSGDPARDDRFDADMAAALTDAATDLQFYEAVYNQLLPGIVFSVEDSVSGQAWTLDEAETGRVRSLVHAICNYLTALVRAQMVYTYYQVAEEDIRSHPYDTAVYLANKLGVQDVNQLIAVNLRLQHPFSVSKDYKIIVPAIGLPVVQLLSHPCPDNRPDAIVELNCQFTISRDASLVDDHFKNLPGVCSVGSVVPPVSGSLAYALAEFDAGFDTADSNLSLFKDFAANFEAAYNHQYPDAACKVAVSNAEDGLTIPATGQLWMVRFGSKGIRWEVTGERAYFAPAALASNLLNVHTVPVQLFDESTGLGASFPRSFVGVDLDSWAHDFLEAIDRFLLLQYAGPAAIVDQHAATESEKCLARIREVKETVTSAILSGDDPDPLNIRFLHLLQLPGYAGNLAEAQESLRQLLLSRLSNAYAIDIIVQLQASIVSPYPAGSGAAPVLYAEPLITTPENSDDDAYSLSAARMPLVNGSSYFTFGLSVGNPENHKKVIPALSFGITYMESGTDRLDFILPGTAGAVITPAAVEVPVPLRSAPAAPLLLSQDILPHPATADDAKARLEELLQWQYACTYQHPVAAQDSLIARLPYNAEPPDATDPEAVAGHRQLLTDLAQFTEVYPLIRIVFDSRLTGITPASSTGQMNSARIAMQAFTTIAERVAGSWQSLQQPGRDTALPPVYYHIADSKLVQDDKGIRKEALCVSVSWQGPGKTPALPVITIPGFTTEAVQPGTTGYLFRNNDTGELLPYAERRNYPDRVLVYPFENILASQQAWAVLCVVRNSGLVAGRLTSRNFLYKTPDVFFTDRFIPRLDTDERPVCEPVNISLLKSNDLAAKDPVELIMANLFKAIFHGQPQGARKISLRVSYSYFLTDDTDFSPARVPVLSIPMFEFSIPRDYDHSPGCADGPEPDNLVCRLAYQLRLWFTQTDPRIEKGQFVFDVSVYPDNNNHMPLLRISNLYLTVADISNLRLS